uniref:TTF-type domain-containing protein n=1 Tax=Latimeria chalumnae TaxID=7897 RepID=H2ZYG6_LATCH
FTFPYDESHRRFSHDWYKRGWLIYSPRLHRLFCFACWLFADKKNEYCSDTWMDPKCGFSNLKKGVEKIEEHENSKIHHNAETELLLTKHRLFQQRENKFRKNRHILRRLIDAALFLAQQGLAFRGHREYSCGSQNEGNYLQLLKLLAKYDALLAQHIKTSKRNETYLSHHIQNDFIHALATEVLSAINHEVQEAKFFSVIVDSTIDIGHVDQFSLSLWAIEHFITFHDLPGSSAEDFFHILESSLETLNINMVHCQGQPYDGDSTMSGNISGLQKHVKEVSLIALFVHCCAHNLNLVLMDAASCCTNTQLLFRTIESLYTFLTSSLPHLRILKEEQEKLDTAVQILKKLSDTRWACQKRAVDTVVQSLPALHKALGGIPNCKPKVVSDAQGLLSTIETFEFKFMPIFWRNVLNKIHTLSTFLQSSTIDLMTALNFLDTCLSDVEAFHSDESFSFFEEIAQQLAKECDTTVTFQEKCVKKNKFNDENLEDCPIKDARQKFKLETYFYLLMVASKFNALNPKTFDDKHAEININAIKDLALFYNSDINEEDLLEEVSKNILSTGTVLPMNEVLSFLLANDMKKVFPNVCILYQIYMTLPVSSANAEHSFSRLKLKNYLQSNMSEERLSDLALLSIERDLADELEYEKMYLYLAHQKTIN